MAQKKKTVKKSAPKKSPAKAAKKSATKANVKAKPAKKSAVKAKPVKTTKPAQKSKAASKSVKAPAKMATPKPSQTNVNLKATQPLLSKAALKKIPALKPLDDRIVIQLKEGEKRTAGGLYIPDTADFSGNHQGTVLAVGQGHKNKKGKLRPMDVKPGDDVLFDQHAGAKLTLEGVEVRILRESEVLGIVETK